MGVLAPIRLRSAIGLAAACGAAQFASLWLSAPVGDALDISKTLLDYCLHGPVANVATIAIVVWFLRRRGEPVRPAAFGVDEPWRVIGPDRRTEWWIGPLLVACFVVAASPLGTWTIDRLWDLAPGPSWALGNPDSYRGSFPLDVTPALVAFQLLVRIPLTVVTEEALFRGLIQSRLDARWAIPITAVLFAAYHLGQWWTVVQLIPFGLALGLIRWWSDSLVPGAIAHYAGNAAYLLMAL